MIYQQETTEGITVIDTRLRGCAVRVGTGRTLRDALDDCNDIPIEGGGSDPLAQALQWARGA